MTEEQWIAASQNGDLSAFNQLVVQYQSVTYNLAYRILGDSDAASDAVQDAFLKAFRAIGRFRRGSFKAWLLRIVTNACYDQLRQQQCRPSVPLSDVLEPDHDPCLIDHAESPEEYALRQELSAVIQQGLALLPPDQRVVVILSDIEGLGYHEIAHVTGVNLGTVKSRLSRARTRLRDYLAGREELRAVVGAPMASRALLHL